MSDRVEPRPHRRDVVAVLVECPPLGAAAGAVDHRVLLGGDHRADLYRGPGDELAPGRLVGVGEALVLAWAGARDPGARRRVVA
ncbi:MAG: hypothetical protein AAF548_19635, partial [Actinomycetota bacterium]